MSRTNGRCTGYLGTKLLGQSLREVQVSVILEFLIKLFLLTRHGACFNRSWNEVAVHDLCWPHDVNTILNIKLHPRATEDFVAWSGENNGIFRVHSAYRIGMQDSLQQLSSGQSSAEPDGDRKIWQLIWKATVSQKMCVFAWRAATESLGVLEGLHRRINTINPTCSICGREVEDTHHALVRCTLARALHDELWSH
jgi:hypothetical protein